MASTVESTTAVTGATSAPKRAPWIDLAQFVVLVVGLFYLAMTGANALNYNWQWYRMPKLLYRVIDGEFVWGPLMEGLFVTFEITAWSLPLAAAIGLTTALLRRSHSFAGRALATGYLQLIRNTPILVQVYIFYFVFAPMFGLGGFWACVLALSFHEGSFAAEIFRAGIESVHKGQWEASDSLGIKRADTYRYVVLPQAIPLMLPPLTSQIVTLIKHSSILSAVAIFDLTTMALDQVAETFMAFEIWLTTGAIYLVVTVTLSVLINLFENRIRRRSQR
jgi:polar amino acid transport system permease protein